MAETAKSINASLYTTHLNIIEHHREKRNLKNKSESLQDIIEVFDKNNNQKKNTLLFLAYPAILVLILIAASQSMYNLFEVTAKEGIPFQSLYDLGQVFMLFGVVALIWFFVNAYIWSMKIRGVELKKIK